jgi:hypothetical protein
MSYAGVVDRVAKTAERSGRQADDIQIVVISKGRTVDEIAAVYEQGHRDFGENRAQELAEKSPRLPRDVRWHFVGPLQTNKVRIVRPTAVLLHSFDRDHLGSAWLKGPGMAPPVLLQVNIGEEPQKHGFAPLEVAGACHSAIDMGLEVRGLMAIPPLGPDAETARPYFVRLRDLRDKVVRDWPSISELSMGMTDDFEVAIEEGATMIRLGRAIFES